MQKKLCSECGEPADVSLGQIVSTVGRAPKQQRCSKYTAFCVACLEGRIKLLQVIGLRSTEQPLREAFTALPDASGMTLSHHKRSVPASSSDGGR